MDKTAVIGIVVLNENEINDCIETGRRYIVTGRRVYEIRIANYKSEYLPYYGHFVCMTKKRLTKKRYEAHTAEEVNEMIGYNLLSN